MGNAIEDLKAMDLALIQQVVVGGHCKSLSRTDFQGPWQLYSFLPASGLSRSQTLPLPQCPPAHHALDPWCRQLLLLPKH